MPAYLWSCAARSDKGPRRDNNEDNYYLDGAFLPEGGESQRSQSAGPIGSGVVAVFDGLGGEQAGEFASYTAARLLGGYRAAFRVCRDGERVKALAEDYLQEAHAALRGRGEALDASVGTTVAMLVFRGGVAHVLNLGDSRVYLLRGGRLTQLSRDHTLAAYLLSRGELSPQEAGTDPRRNALTRHLGGRDETYGLRPHFVPQIRVTPGDRFLLCSDGVSGMLSQAELLKGLKSGRGAAAAVDNLVRMAIRAGGRDNATAAAAFVNFRIF